MARRNDYWSDKFGYSWDGPESAPSVKREDRPYIITDGTPSELAVAFAKLDTEGLPEDAKDVYVEITPEDEYGYQSVSVIRHYWVPATAEDIAAAEAELARVSETQRDRDAEMLELIRERSPELFS